MSKDMSKDAMNVTFNAEHNPEESEPLQPNFQLSETSRNLMRQDIDQFGDKKAHELARLYFEDVLVKLKQTPVFTERKIVYRSILA